MSAEDRFRFATLALEALRAPSAFAPLGLHPADVEVIPNFSGAPDRMEAWLIFEDRERAADVERVADVVRQRATEVLAEAGFPTLALDSFRLGVTSTTDIEERGGRFFFFR
jgi:hypothetical protein